MKVCSLTPRKYNISIKPNSSSGNDDDSDSDNENLFIKLFSCSKCGESYDTFRQLERHKRQKHLKTRKRTRRNPVKRLFHSYTESEESYAGLEDEDKIDDGGNVSCVESDVSSQSCARTTENPAKGQTQTHGVYNRWKCTVRVVLERLRFYEIYVSTPAKGFREIYYTAEADKTSSSSSSSSCFSSSDDSGSPNGMSSAFQEWRLETIKALPRKVVSPERPTTKGKSKSVPVLKPIDMEEEDKSVLLEMPSQLSYLFNVNGRKDDLHSILDVITGHGISTLVMDAYIPLRVSRYNNEINAGVRSAYKLRPISQTKFFSLSLQFLPVFTKTQNPSKFEPNLKFLPKLPAEEDFVLIAPLFACRHFYLAVFDATTKSVYVYDSAWHYFTNELRLEQVKKILIYLFPRSPYKWTIYFRFNCAQQIDESSCGCYVVYFAENHFKGKSHRYIRKLNKAEVQQIRNDIAIELLPTTKYGSQFLEAITE